MNYEEEHLKHLPRIMTLLSSGFMNALNTGMSVSQLLKQTEEEISASGNTVEAWSEEVEKRISAYEECLTHMIDLTDYTTEEADQIRSLAALLKG